MSIFYKRLIIYFTYSNINFILFLPLQFYSSWQFLQKKSIICIIISQSFNSRFRVDWEIIIFHTIGESEIQDERRIFFQMTGRKSIFNIYSLLLDFDKIDTIDLSPSSCSGSNPRNERRWCRLRGCPRYRTPSPRNWPRRIEWCERCRCINPELARVRRCLRSRSPRRVDLRRTVACAKSASTACTPPCTARWSPVAASPGEGSGYVDPAPSHPSRSLSPVDQERENSKCEIERERKNCEINFIIGIFMFSSEKDAFRNSIGRTSIKIFSPSLSLALPRCHMASKSVWHSEAWSL